MKGFETTGVGLRGMDVTRGDMTYDGCPTTQETPAVVNYAPEKGSVEVREIEKRTIGAEDVLLEVADVGVWGSDPR